MGDANSRRVRFYRVRAVAHACGWTQFRGKRYWKGRLESLEEVFQYRKSDAARTHRDGSHGAQLMALVDRSTTLIVIV